MKTKTDRVVLNLQQSEAIELNSFIKGFLETESAAKNNPMIVKISKQLSKTTIKNQAIDNLRKMGAEPTKEEEPVNEHMEPAKGKAEPMIEKPEPEMEMSMPVPDLSFMPMVKEKNVLFCRFFYLNHWQQSCSLWSRMM